jgi:sulfite reductase (ferredoxin)
MQSFQTELENPLVEKDIIELEKKIRLFREGKIDEEKFRSLRLARGVYGQRQPGVQMIRIKLPYGKVTTKQLLRIADISDEYSIGRLHLTTRQDIQIHFVSLDRTPELWAKLEQDDITLREACGNTVRNITASSNAGIDPEELFDVSPYAHEMFKYFLRNPVCQDMGRKIKIAFSSSDADTAFTFMHDIGFIPRVKEENGQTVRGFKVLIGGGLGAQPFLAKTAFEFLHEDQIIPYTEALLRVFDRHGERASRHKARLKFLLQKIGLEELTRLVEAEHRALKVQSFKVDLEAYRETLPSAAVVSENHVLDQSDLVAFHAWVKTNTFEQKQKGYFGVYLKIATGDIFTDKARELVDVVRKYAADDIRITVNQGILLKFVSQSQLQNLYAELKQLDLVSPGFNSTADITSCPGTDTCNLGITSSTGITRELENVIHQEFPDLIYNSDIKIKISGCMNSCGQHAIANIGFHGSSLKSGVNVLPALQVLLGGGVLGEGEGRVSAKVIKVPSKRGPAVLRSVLNDYETNAEDGEYFNAYYDRKGKDYFYQLLKPIADLTTLTPNEYIDWGHETTYQSEIGVGECAGVVIDLVSTLLYESEEKLDLAKDSLQQGNYSDSIYHSYSVFISTAKALLLDKQVSCNTQTGILNDFDKHLVAAGAYSFTPDFRTHVLQINRNEPTAAFATQYLTEAEIFLKEALAKRDQQLITETT